MSVFPPIFLNNYKDLVIGAEYRLIDTSYSYSLFIKLLAFHTSPAHIVYNKGTSLNIKYLNLCNNKLYSKRIFSCYNFFLGLTDIDKEIAENSFEIKSHYNEGDLFFVVLHKNFLEDNLERFVKCCVYILNKKNDQGLTFENFFSKETKIVTATETLKRRWVKLDVQSINWVNLLVL